jgi:hypothetical protein
LTPSGSSTPVTTPDNSTAQVSKPVTVSPTTSNSDGQILKVNYYLNNKLVATVNQPPYRYKVNTTKLRNSKYKLTTKTYYTSGKINLDSEYLKVSNPFSFSQVLLQIRHLAWLIVLALVLLVGFGLLRNRLMRRQSAWLKATTDPDLTAMIHTSETSGTETEESNEIEQITPTATTPSEPTAVAPEALAPEPEATADSEPVTPPAPTISTPAAQQPSSDDEPVIIRPDSPESEDKKDQL